MTTPILPTLSSIQISHDTHSSKLICGERGTGKTTRAVVVAIGVLREGGKFLSNVDINPKALDTVVPFPHSDHWDNAVVRLPDSPHGFSLHTEIIGEGWYILKGVKKYSITLFDECAHYLNSRRWDDDSRQDFIDAMIHQRKRGYSEVYLAHGLAQIDSQVRDNYITMVELLLNRPPQLSRRWLAGNSPVVCTLKRASDGKFPTDVTDKKVWSQGLVTTQAYSKSNKLVWNLYSTNQMFDFEHYRSNTVPVLPDGARLFGFPVHNIFAGYQYVSPRRDSKGNLKRDRKQFAFFRMGSYAVISPRLLNDCYYVQSKTLEYFNQQLQHYALSECAVPVFAPKVDKVDVSNGLEKDYYRRMGLLILGGFVILGVVIYYYMSVMGFFPEPSKTEPPKTTSKVELPKVESPPVEKTDQRFKKPPGAKFATYPVCEFFNLLEIDHVTELEGKHMIDRDWLLQHFRNGAVKVVNFYLDTSGMPRFTLLFSHEGRVVDSTDEKELFNFGWRAAMVGHNNSHLAIYNPTIWIFFPVNASQGVQSVQNAQSGSSTVFSLPTFAQ